MEYIKSWVPTGFVPCYGLGTSTFARFKRLTGEEAKLVDIKPNTYQKQVGTTWAFESPNFVMYHAQLCLGCRRLVLVTREVALAK